MWKIPGKASEKAEYSNIRESIATTGGRILNHDNLRSVRGYRKEKIKYGQELGIK